LSEAKRPRDFLRSASEAGQYDVSSDDVESLGIKLDAPQLTCDTLASLRNTVQRVRHSL
jgi:hypothetical protein